MPGLSDAEPALTVLRAAVPHRSGMCMMSLWHVHLHGSVQFWS